MRRDLTFVEWAKKYHPRYKWYRHCVEIAGVLQRAADDFAEFLITGAARDDAIRRIMIFLPPRHSKSETVSRMFSAYWLWRFGTTFVGLASYSAELAYSLSRAARDNYRLAGGVLDPSARAIKHWQTEERGGFWATGVGGPATGKGAHLRIIDDPLKNAKDAQSTLIREGQKEWKQSVWDTRAEPGDVEIHQQTRWNEDDLAGWMLAQEQIEADALAEGEEDADPERWYVIYLPAIAEKPEDRLEFPSTCTVHPDWREPGEPLCPERYPLRRLRTLMKRVGSYFWAALFQQRPTPKDGTFFKVGQIEIVGELPASARLNLCRAWDKGSTEDGDPTASVKMAGPCKDGYFYILDATENQLNTAERDRFIKQTAASDGLFVRIVGPEDPGAAGKTDSHWFMRLLAGFNVKVKRVSGKKELRAGPVSSQVNAGNVRMVIPSMKNASRYTPMPKWAEVLMERLRTFPHAKRDDLVDALADAFVEIAGAKYSTGLAGPKREQIEDKLGA